MLANFRVSGYPPGFGSGSCDRKAFRDLHCMIMHWQKAVTKRFSIQRITQFEGKTSQFFQGLQLIGVE